MMKGFSAALLWLMCFAAVAPAADATGEFTLSFWCGPPDQFVTVARYQQIKDAGFTHVFPPCSGSNSVEVNHKRLEVAAKVGLKVFVADARIPVSLGANEKAKAALDACVADYSKYPALGGYFIADEPGPSSYPALAEVVARLREKDPAHPGFINLLPNYAPAWAIGKSYDDYVEQYIKIVKPFAVSYDHYHFTKGGDGPLFFKNLETVRAICLKHDVPFWNIVQANDYGPYRKLTEAEKRFEAMQTLVYGGKGLLYFTYWQPPPGGEGWTWGKAIVSLDGTPTPQYEHVKRINHDLQAMGKYLVTAKSLAVDQAAAPKDIPVVLNDDHCTLGLFAGDGARRYLLLTSRDYKQARDVDVRITSAAPRIERLDKASGNWSAFPAKSVVKLAPGDGELLRW
jgi:hypothetical protein